MTEMVKKPGTDRRHTTWQLARLAGCGDPDVADGVGLEPSTYDPHADLAELTARREAYGLNDTDADRYERLLARCAASVSGPTGSAGARFLRSVEDAVYECWDSHDGMIGDEPVRPDADCIHEIADAAPDVYTYTRWQEFVDLAAWQEDADTGMGDDLTDMAGLALYAIAERLAWALLEELAEGEEEETCDECGTEVVLTVSMFDSHHAESCSLNPDNVV